MTDQKLKIEVGCIVSGLTPSESVEITKIQALGKKYSLFYTGVNTKKAGSKIVTAEQIDTLEILTSEGEFNFKGDPERFVLYAEAERIKSAYQFDPLFAINCSVVDPLPHQVEAVYKFLLPQPKIRFLLADDTGAGKTIMTGLLLKELLMRHIVERILIITPGYYKKSGFKDIRDYHIVGQHFICHYPCVSSGTPKERLCKNAFDKSECSEIWHGHIHEKHSPTFDGIKRHNMCVDYAPNAFKPVLITDPDLQEYFYQFKD